MDLGSGAFSEAATIPGYTLDDGQWHHVEIRRNARQVCCSIFVLSLQTVFLTGTRSEHFALICIELSFSY